MGLHTDLDIHKAGYALLKLMVELIRSFPRDLKRVIGDRLRDECLELLVDVREANIARDKRPHLDGVTRRMERAHMLLRVAQDLRCISPAQFGRAIELTTSIGKQAHGWAKRFPATSPAA